MKEAASENVGSNWRRMVRWSLLFLVVVLAAFFLPWRTSEPTYQGKTLRQWMRGHPREYHPAVQAMGTNALPFLLQELQVTDSAIASMCEKGLGRLSIGALWETARMRHYRARLALQILDTNAVSALLEAVFKQPVHLKTGDRGCEAALALNWMASPQALEQVRQALSEALQSPHLQTRRNACLAFSVGFPGTPAEAAQLVALTRDPEPLVRAAATRAFLVWQTNGTEVLSALIARLDDEQAAIRLLAIEALAVRKASAVVALPALQEAYAKELSRPTLTDDIDDGFRGRTLSTQNLRSAIRAAMRAIAPSGPLPGETH